MTILLILLILHNLLRWVILIFGFLAVLGALKDQPKPLRIYAIFVTLQFLIGLALWLNLIFSQILDFKKFNVRFFVLEHPTLMLLSLISSHVALAKSKRGGNSWKILTIISLIFILVGIPWWRPLIRL